MMTLLVGNWFHLITKGKKKKKIQLTRSRWSLQVYDASPYVSVFEGIARRIKKRKTHACVENLHGHSFDGWIIFPGLSLSFQCTTWAFTKHRDSFVYVAVADGLLTTLD